MKKKGLKQKIIWVNEKNEEVIIADDWLHDCRSEIRNVSKAKLHIDKLLRWEMMGMVQGEDETSETARKMRLGEKYLALAVKIMRRGIDKQIAQESKDAAMEIAASIPLIV
jgi:hypothetical protein